MSGGISGITEVLRSRARLWVGVSSPSSAILACDDAECRQVSLFDDVAVKFVQSDIRLDQRNVVSHGSLGTRRCPSQCTRLATLKHEGRHPVGNLSYRSQLDLVATLTRPNVNGKPEGRRCLK